MTDLDRAGRLAGPDALGLADEAANENADRPSERDKVPELEPDLRVGLARLAEDDPVQQDQDDRGHPDDHRDLAGAPVEHVPADHDPGEDERRAAGRDEQRVERAERLPAGE